MTCPHSLRLDRSVCSQCLGAVPSISRKLVTIPEEAVLDILGDEIEYEPDPEASRVGRKGGAAKRKREAQRANLRKRRSDERALQIRALLAEGLAPGEVADRLKINVRSVYRAKEGV